MKTETKQYKYLKKLVGKEIIRIKPCECSYGTDYSYTSEPIRVVSISKEEFVFEEEWNSKLRKKNAEWMAKWLDGNWYSVEDAKRLPKTKLNELQGEMICTKTGEFSSGHVDYSFNKESVRLILATKYHIVLDWNGKELWLNSRKTDPNDWQKA